ncbi:hypothetical protein F383_32346 [Gossypium arboreum]|uniref:Uncharacterized protein n=1 Tax=Gossypium arboreum TaxID=29729 RepID=A0A0B0PK94_GOSAR|nr:hypothetical protein F383_32346 [Gossypium arboreum]
MRLRIRPYPGYSIDM